MLRKIRKQNKSLEGKHLYQSKCTLVIFFSFYNKEKENHCKYYCTFQFHKYGIFETNKKIVKNVLYFSTLKTI